jgi:hypothetical protein
MIGLRIKLITGSTLVVGYVKAACHERKLKLSFVSSHSPLWNDECQCLLRGPVITELHVTSYQFGPSSLSRCTLRMTREGGGKCGGRVNGKRFFRMSVLNFLKLCKKAFIN